MNQLTTKDAIQNLQNLINAGLRGGLFQEPNAVFAVQASLDTLKQMVEGVPATNGVKEPDKDLVAK